MTDDILDVLRWYVKRCKGSALGQDCERAADEIERLRKALKPFAQAVWYETTDGAALVTVLDDEHQPGSLTAGDFRRARAAEGAWRMKCPKCNGEGWLPKRTNLFEPRPCPDCYGSGEVSCCGDLGLPEPEQEASDE